MLKFDIDRASSSSSSRSRSRSGEPRSLGHWLEPFKKLCVGGRWTPGAAPARPPRNAQSTPSFTRSTVRSVQPSSGVIRGSRSRKLRISGTSTRRPMAPGTSTRSQPPGEPAGCVTRQPSNRLISTSMVATRAANGAHPIKDITMLTLRPLEPGLSDYYGHCARCSIGCASFAATTAAKASSAISRVEAVFR